MQASSGDGPYRPARAAREASRANPKLAAPHPKACRGPHGQYVEATRARARCPGSGVVGKAAKRRPAVRRSCQEARLFWQTSVLCTTACLRAGCRPKTGWALTVTRSRGRKAAYGAARWGDYALELTRRGAARRSRHSPCIWPAEEEKIGDPDPSQRARSFLPSRAAVPARLGSAPEGLNGNWWLFHEQIRPWAEQSRTIIAERSRGMPKRRDVGGHPIDGVCRLQGTLVVPRDKALAECRSDEAG